MLSFISRKDFNKKIFLWQTVLPPKKCGEKHFNHLLNPLQVTFYMASFIDYLELINDMTMTVMHRAAWQWSQVTTLGQPTESQSEECDSRSHYHNVTLSHAEQVCMPACQYVTSVFAAKPGCFSIKFMKTLHIIHISNISYI